MKNYPTTTRLLALLAFSAFSLLGVGSAAAATVDILSVTIGPQGGTPATYGTANNAITYTVAIGGDGASGGGTVTPSVSGLPAGVTGVFSPTSASQGNTPGTNNFTLTLTTTAAAIATNTASFTVTATGSPGGTPSSLNTTGTLLINKKSVTITGVSASGKTYDGTTTATLSGGSVSGTINGDTVTVVAGTGVFGSKNAGSQTVTASGYSLGGTHASLYTLSAQPTVANATISAKALTYTGLSVPGSKIYDGTTTAVVSGTPALQGTEAAGTGSTSDGKPYDVDSVSLTGTATGTYNSKDVASATTVTFGGISLTGTGNGNYSLTAATQSATVTAKSLSVTGLTASSKTYDGTTTATLGGAAALLTAEAPGTGNTSDGKPYTGDTVTLGGTAAGTFANKNVATSKTVTVTGNTISDADSGNYTLLQQTGLTADINAATLTVSASGISRLYDGTTNATVTLSDNRVGGDVFTSSYNSAGFASKHVGTGKTVSVGGISISGTDAGNYSANTTATASAIIAQTNITVTAVNNTKTYDGTTSAAAIPNVTSGSIQTGDTANFSEAYDTADVGVGNKTLIPSGSVSDGNGGANYNVTFVNFTTGTINQVNAAPTLDAITSVTINEDASQQTVNLTGIGMGSGDSGQTLTVTAASSNTGLIPNPTVTYTSANATGSISYTPVANASGIATITVTVQDNGGTVNGGTDTFSRVFTVTVTAVNDAPTLDALTSVTISEDASQQTVNLSGISAGGGESQTLTVTASSSSTGLIPNPSVTYTSANTGGSISFTPVANQSGTATLTVTVNDGGGTANGGVESVSQSFTVTVTAVNDAPTLDAISSLTVNDTAGTQNVSLTGISSGPASESGQTIIVSAVSSDTSIIATPSITYSSPNATGTLAFTPTVSAEGTVTITVTVNDGGGTANGGVESVNRSFTVFVSALHAPEAGDQTLGMREDEQLNITLSATDINGGPLTYTLLTSPTRGALTAVSGDTNYTYIPARNYAGLDSFTFRVTDNTSLSATGTVSIIVTNVIDLYPYAFTNALSLASGSNPVSIVSAKFYKKADLAVANFADNTIRIFLGAQIAATNPAALANGLFTNATPAAVLHTGNGPVALGVADFNVDTFNDLAVVNKTDGTVQLYHGQGNGQFTTNAVYAMGTAPNSLAVGDLNKDGIKDLVVANENDDTITVRLGTGGGNFGSPMTFSVGAHPSAVAIGDFNKDMKMDVVVANYNDNNISILRGNGLALGFTLSNKIDFAVGQNPTALAVFDFNKDGRPDIVTANFGDDTITVLRGALVTNAIVSGKPVTTNTFVKTNYPVAINPSALAVVDLNKDKLSDLVIAGHYENTVSVMLGRSNVQFEPFFFNDPSASQPVGTNPVSLVTGAFNSDMDLDVAVANWGSGNVSVLLNNYTPVAYSQKITVMENTTTLPQASRSTWITLNGTYGPLNYIITSGPTNGTFVETNGGLTNSLVPLQFRYQTFSNANGKDLITFYVREYTTNNTGKTSKAPAKVEITITPVNDPPSFTLASANVVRNEDAGIVSIPGFAASLNRGANGHATEVMQGIYFVLTNSLTNLFTSQPAIDSAGLLKFTLKPNAFGVATVGVTMKDKGGTLNGGNDTSSNQTFTITVVQSNDTPTLKVITALASFKEDTNATMTFAVTDVETPAANLTYSVLNVTNTTIFPDVTGPAVAEGSSSNFVFGWSGTNRTLKVVPATNQFGTNVIWVRVSDGTNSVTSTQTVAVASINDAPSFTLGTSVVVNSTNGAPRTYTGWATGMSAGPANESSQTLSFVLVPSSTALFNVKPAISNAANGTLTFTPKAGVAGSVNVSIYLKDNATPTGYSATNTFSITVTP